MIVKVLERNFRLKLSGPDYKNKDPSKALSDFRHRVANYEKAYDTVGDWEEEHDIQYCKLVNVGKKVIAHNISGYLSGQCIFYLMNFNLAGKVECVSSLRIMTYVDCTERQIFVTRHGESEDNRTGRIGGDAPVSVPMIDIKWILMIYSCLKEGENFQKLWLDLSKRDVLHLL